MKRTNKKGSIQEILFMAIFLFVLAIIIIVGAKIGTDFNKEFQSKDISTQAKETIQNNTDKYSNVFDYIYLTVFVVFALGIMVSVFLLDTHPVLFWIAIILLAFALIPLVIINNAFSDFVTNSNIEAEYVNFTIMDFLFNDYVLTFAVIGIIIIVLLYSRTR